MAAQVASMVTIRMVDAASIKSPIKRASPNSPSPRRQSFAARELDPFLRNLSPAATLEALKASNAVDSSAGSKHSLLTDSISSVSPSERALGIRAAVAAKKLREWHTEIRSWLWPSSQYEPPLLAKQQDTRRRSHNGSIDEVFADERFVDDRYDMTYWGSLPAQTVQQYEQRLEEMQDGLEALGIEDLKKYIRQAHLPNDPSTQSLPIDPSRVYLASCTYNRLDDFTVVITATIMQMLPFLSRLSTLMELWQTRLLVLRQVPIFLHQLEDAETAMASAKASVRKGVQTDLTRETYHTMKDVLASRTAALAQTLDNMLDILEDRPDTLPDHWIDDMENVEQQYQNWVVAAEQVVMVNELDELRSTTFDHPDVNCTDSRLDLESYRSKANSAQELGSQSDLTAVEDEDAPEHNVLMHKQTSATGKKSRESDWAGTEAIKIHVAKNVARRPSLTYSDLSEDPEVIQTAQIHYVCLSPTIASNPAKPSLIEISSGSSKRSSHHSTRSDGATSPSLTRSGSTSTDESRNYHQDDPAAHELGVSGPPAVLAPWPPRNASGVRLAMQRTGASRAQESWLYDSDSEDEGGLRSYGNLSSMTRSNQASIQTISHSRDRSLVHSTPTGPLISVDDFFDSVVQPFSELSVPDSTAANRPFSTGGSIAMKLEVPSRTTSKRTKPKPRKQTSSRAVSAGSRSYHLETQLNLRISNLLNRTSAPIRFLPSPERDQLGVASAVGHHNHSSHSSVLTGPHAIANDRHIPPSLSHPNSVTTHPRTLPLPRSTQSEIRLYYLHHPSHPQPTKLYVRLVGEAGERVMVRVGGGWSDLEEYLHEYAAHHGRFARTRAKGTELESRDLPLWETASFSKMSKVRTKARGEDGGAIGYNSLKQNSHASGVSHAHELFSTGRNTTFASTTESRSTTRTPVSSHVGKFMATSSLRPGHLPIGLSPAGPLVKQKDISPRKKAWVEDVVCQARKVSSETSDILSDCRNRGRPLRAETRRATSTARIIVKKRRVTHTKDEVFAE